MKKQKKAKRITSPTKQKVLLLLLAGVILSMNKSIATHRKIFKIIPKAWKDIEKQYLYRIIDEFYNDRLVDWQENKDGTIKVVLTEKGRLLTHQFDPDYLAIKKPANWDKRWRVVMYDIPISKNKARNAIRSKLNQLGFKEWQKSVFVHPYPCQDEINFVIEFFDLRPYVRYAELINPTNEAELKLHFKL